MRRVMAGIYCFWLLQAKFKQPALFSSKAYKRRFNRLILCKTPLFHINRIIFATLQRLGKEGRVIFTYHSIP